MQAVLLLELCFEFLFLFLRCFADRQLIDNRGDNDDPPAIDVTMRGYVFVRAIYVVPVLVLNCAIYWIGGGPTGTCMLSLPSFLSLLLVFTKFPFSSQPFAFLF